MEGKYMMQTSMGWGGAGHRCCSEELRKIQLFSLPRELKQLIQLSKEGKEVLGVLKSTTRAREGMGVI